jgi:hypothetical protein
MLSLFRIFLGPHSFQITPCFSLLSIAVTDFIMIIWYKLTFNSNICPCTIFSTRIDACHSCTAGSSIDKCISQGYKRRRFERGSPSPVNGAGLFQGNYERVRSLERAHDETIVCFLYPCSLGIRGFESHPPHLCTKYVVLEQ